MTVFFAFSVAFEIATTTVPSAPLLVVQDASGCGLIEGRQGLGFSWGRTAYG